MNLYRSLYSGLICILTLFITLSTTFAQWPTEQPSPVSAEERGEVEKAIYTAVKQQEGEHLVTLMYQTQVVDLTFTPMGNGHAHG